MEMEVENKCPNCQRGIPIDAKICPYCGRMFGEIVEKKHTGAGIASLVLGIIAMCLIWLTFIPIVSVSYFFIHLPMSILAIVFGSIGYWSKKRHDGYGLSGLILGILVLILGFIFMMISAYLYVRGFS